MNYIQILYLCILKQPTHRDYVANWSCELHSNLVSLHSETTLPLEENQYQKLWITFKSCIFAFWNNYQKKNQLGMLLWITFKSCIFAFWNNSQSRLSDATIVVNYIQILYLCILKQRRLVRCRSWRGCELHSNLVSLHSETTCLFGYYLFCMLWITFKSCIFAFWNNPTLTATAKQNVVNYIQILYLCILKQLLKYWTWKKTVVNYIQILYLCILKQHCENFIIAKVSCELHSNLVSLHSETTFTNIASSINSCELHSNLVSLHSETTRACVVFRI